MSLNGREEKMTTIGHDDGSAGGGCLLILATLCFVIAIGITLGAAWGFTAGGFTAFFWGVALVIANRRKS